MKITNPYFLQAACAKVNENVLVEITPFNGTVSFKGVSDGGYAKYINSHGEETSEELIGGEITANDVVGTLKIFNNVMRIEPTSNTYLIASKIVVNDDAQVEYVSIKNNQAPPAGNTTLTLKGQNSVAEGGYVDISGSNEATISAYAADFLASLPTLTDGKTRYILMEEDDGELTYMQEHASEKGWSVITSM